MSTFLTLFVVPCAYLIVHAIGDRVSALLYGDRRRTAEPATLPLTTSHSSH